MCAGVDRLGTYASIHLNVFVRKPCAEFCNLGKAAFDELLSATAWECFPLDRCEKTVETEHTRIHGHDEKHIGELADFGGYRSGGGVRGDCYPSLHVSLVDRVDKGDGIRCNTVSVWDLGLLCGDERLTCSLDMETVEGSTGVCYVINPLIAAVASCYRLQ